MLSIKGVKMATRSSIAIQEADGTVSGIYCHWDGNLGTNGRILKDHYTDTAKIRELISLGSLSSLRAQIGEKQDFDKPTNHEWCVVYGRDREEDNTHPRNFDNIEHWLEAMGEEYNYLWDGSEWLVNGFVTKHEFRSVVQIMLERSKDNQ